jgi:hypothetical protein
MRMLPSSCLSVCLSAWINSAPRCTDFEEILYLRLFRKSVEKIPVSLKSDKNNGYFTWRLFIFMTISRWLLRRIRNVSSKSCRKNQNTHFVFSNFFPKVVPFMRQCGKIWWSQRGHKWRHNVAHTRYMLEKQGYTPTHQGTCTHARALTRTHRQKCNTYCFSTAIIVARTRLNVTLYVHCLSCLVWERRQLWNKCRMYL